MRDEGREEVEGEQEDRLQPPGNYPAPRVVSAPSLTFRRFERPYRGASPVLADYVRSHLRISRGHLQFPDFWVKEELFVTSYAAEGDDLAALIYEQVEVHLPYHKGVDCGITFEWRLGRVGSRRRRRSA